MSTEQEFDPLEDTDRLQKAIEKVADEETASLPPLPLSGIRTEDDKAEDESDHETDLTKAPVHTWFFTFMCINIPIVGWFYLFYLAFNKKKTERRNFARAYLFYKLIFLLVSAVILGILIYIGLGLLDQLLAYMDML